MKKFYHVVTDWDGGDLLPLAHKYRAGDDAIEQFLARWPDAGSSLADYHVHQVHLYATEDEARTHAVHFGGSVLVINADQCDVRVDDLEFDHPVCPRVPAQAIRRLEK